MDNRALNMAKEVVKGGNMKLAASLTHHCHVAYDDTRSIVTPSINLI